MRIGFGIFRSSFGRAALYLSSLFGAATLAICLYLLIAPRRDVYDLSHVHMPCLLFPTDGGEYRARPDCRGVSRIGSREAEMRFNSAGLRDREYSALPGPGVYRILLLGSSNVLGPGVEEGATLPRRLEQSLRSAGREVEVLNAGMVGYCTAQSSLRLKELVERYSPHLVMYQFVQGTCPLFDGAWGPRVEFEDGEAKRISRAPFAKDGPLRGLNAFVYGHAPLFFFWLSVTDQLRKAEFSRMYSEGRSPRDRATIYMEPTLSLLSYMRNVARNRGAGFVVLSYRMKPFTQTMPGYFYRLPVRLLAPLVRPIDFGHDEIFGVLERAGFRYIYPELVTKDLLMDGDPHLNEEGTLLFAREVARELASVIPAAKGKRR